MAIDTVQIRQKTHDLNRRAATIVDVINMLESGEVAGDGIPLTSSQIVALQDKLKVDANTLKDIAGDIKNLANG